MGTLESALVIANASPPSKLIDMLSSTISHDEVEPVNHFKELFLLDPEIIFLNHGSYGATPKAVFDTYQAWQLRLERQPVKFLGREIREHLRTSRVALGEYLGASSDDLIYVPNATFGVNVAARSLDLGPGDEVLTSDQEYGACNNTWTYLSRQKGFTYSKHAVPLPVENAEQLLESFWQGVSDMTKVIYLSHITSSTALTLPVQDICARARENGIITVIDGAHAPGQLALDLTEIDADFYTGNCHKWLCSPKGAGFLYARKEVQDRIEPIVVSHGYTADPSVSAGSSFLDYYEWLGTNDPAAYLAVPAAIAFQQEHDWPSVREHCHQLLRECLETIQGFSGLGGLYPTDSHLYQQLAVACLPDTVDTAKLKTSLYDEENIEVTFTQYAGKPLMRISVQAYNTAEELEVLCQALEARLR